MYPYRVKRDLTAVMSLYYAARSNMDKKDIFDIFNLVECCVYKIDKYYSHNVHDYEGMLRGGTKPVNDGFTDWFNRIFSCRYQETYEKLLNRIFESLNRIKNEKNYSRFMMEIYRQLGISERKDKHNDKQKMKLRIERFAAIFGIDEENFKTKFVTFPETLRNYKIIDGQLTNTQLIIKR